MNSYGRDVNNRFTRERLVFDQDVHLAIAELSGNETLQNMLRHIFERIVLKRRTDSIYDPAAAPPRIKSICAYWRPWSSATTTRAVAIVPQPYPRQANKM